MDDWRSWIQFFHHIEHALLQTQAILGHNLLGRPVPTSLVQLWVPRVELHLFYNTIVFIPMVIAMYYHLFPPAAEKTRPAVLLRASRRRRGARGARDRAFWQSSPRDCRSGCSRAAVVSPPRRRGVDTQPAAPSSDPRP